MFDLVRLRNSIKLNPWIEFDFLNVCCIMPGVIAELCRQHEKEKETHDFLMASGIARGRICMTTESRNMVAILQIIG